MRGPGNIGYPPGGLRRANRRGPKYLASGPSALVWDSVYIFDEASGNLQDRAGSAHLNVNGTPTFGQTVQGRRGILYDAVDERHMAQVRDVGTTSFVAFCVCSFAALAGTGGIFGGYDAAAADDGWLAYRNGSAIEFHFRSSAAGGNVSVASGVVLQTGRLYLVSMQGDRVDGQGRGRITPLAGAPDAKSVSIAALGTMSAGANHLYGFGSTPLLAAGVTVHYGGIRINADAAGATMLADVHQSAGWE